MQPGQWRYPKRTAAAIHHRKDKNKPTTTRPRSTAGLRTSLSTYSRRFVPGDLADLLVSWEPHIMVPDNQVPPGVHKLSK